MGEDMGTAGNSTMPSQRERASPRAFARESAPQMQQTGMVSVIIPCFGQYEYTRLCVPSVLRYSIQPFELIFVDVGSLDGTTEYLAGLQAGSSVPIEVVVSKADAGLGGAFDLGLRRSRGNLIVLLGNDVIVTHGWLNQMTALASLDAKIGAVGPMSNYGTPPQLVPEVPYRLKLRAGSPNVPEEALERFAHEWREAHRGKWFLTDHLDTFCLLLRREVLGAIGPIETLPFTSNRELSPKALDAKGVSLAIRQTGAKMACCQDLFIHHFGTRQAVLFGSGSGDRTA
jgi:glycosyltransferase involved in cell wall biosynthesis